MTRDELETMILNAKGLDSVEVECNEWYSKYHDKTYISKGLKPGEFTYPTIKEEILLTQGLRNSYLQLNPLPVNNFMNESALKAILHFFDAHEKNSLGAEAAAWSLHARALRTAMEKRSIKTE